ncbi:MAG TPA: formyltransferase family protein, partial [Gemmatimonadales bacterium]|nr:formyltransferase family protein [Gemmatimonadales bacterium]
MDPAAREFLGRIDEHPEIELAGGVCQSRGLSLRHQAVDVIRRRGVLAPAVLAVYAAQGARRLLDRRARLRRRRRERSVLAHFLAVERMHDPTVLQHVRALAPDLGLVYGAPILKPELFEIPRFGTLGIHHGALPDYRGKKTAFWAMVNREPAAGVTIQRINAGVDTGEIVSAGSVTTAGKRYGRVDAELQALG